jgi:hypothetical protein
VVLNRRRTVTKSPPSISGTNRCAGPAPDIGRRTPHRPAFPTRVPDVSLYDGKFHNLHRESSRTTGSKHFRTKLGDLVAELKAHAVCIEKCCGKWHFGRESSVRGESNTEFVVRDTSKVVSRCPRSKYFQQIVPCS